MYTKPAVLALLFAGANASNSVQEAELIVKGILEGAVKAEGLTNIETCIQDVETVVKDSEIAIQDFEKKDAKDVIAGIKEVGEVIKVIKSAVVDCKNIKADWEKLEKMASIFSSPYSFAYHVGKDLIVNGV